PGRRHSYGESVRPGMSATRAQWAAKVGADDAPIAASGGVPVLEVRGVRKSVGATEVLGGIDLAVREGELVAIVGFSGSGKSTLISLLAGLTAPTAGSVLFEGAEVTGPGPDRGVVFQSYSLMPWLTVRGNVALAVDAVLRGRPKKERRAVVSRYVEMVGL